MDRSDSFLTRKLKSVWQRLRQPVGGAKEPPPPPVSRAKEPTFDPLEEIIKPLSQSRPDDRVVNPEPPVVAAPKTTRKQLWGQEFNVVSQGLAEEQVVHFVDNMMVKCKALEEQQKHFLSLGSLTEKAAVDADKAAADIKARARSEAEAEAARIVAEASRKTQEMIAEAKREAQDTTRQEVQDILQTAIRKSAIIELQARQQAQLFLIRSRETIEDDLRNEVKGVYHRLLSGLQELQGEGNRQELEWGGRTDQLRQVETFELPAHEAVHSDLRAELASLPPLADIEYEAEIGISKESEGEVV